MTKNIKLSFILIAVYSAIIIAWRTLNSFFTGLGLNIVALFTIITILLTISLTDKHTFSRIKDMFIITIVFAVLELIVYFGIEFVIDDFSHVGGFLVYQNILSVFGLLFFAYIAFRFITEVKNIKISFIEFILGNHSSHKKPKKAIELTNGTLEDKPNRTTEKNNTLESFIETKDEE